MSQLVRKDKDYASWIEELSQRYRKSQIKAATHVNSEMLQFYWSLGKDIVTLRAESRWGDKFIASLSAYFKDQAIRSERIVGNKHRISWY